MTYQKVGKGKYFTSRFFVSRGISPLSRLVYYSPTWKEEKKEKMELFREKSFILG
jgi:hypothetical protein